MKLNTDKKRVKNPTHNGRKTLSDIVEQLKITTNPVTYWALKQCMIDRIDRHSFD